MDGEERVGGMMAVDNPPRDGEGDRAKRGGGGSHSLRRPTVSKARRLRRDMTLPEVLLWQELRSGKLGVKFRRQHPLDPYVADFFCSAARLIIEVDGDAHNRGDNPHRDMRRDAALGAKGYRTLRISAVDVMQDLAGVVERVRSAVSPLHHPADGPPPRAGEEL